MSAAASAAGPGSASEAGPSGDPAIVSAADPAIVSAAGPAAVSVAGPAAVSGAGRAAEADRAWMLEALAEATAATTQTTPHAPVGAVVVHEGQCVARGRLSPGAADPPESPESPESPELVALRALARPVPGATLFTTLEPLGLPPEVLRAAGVVRVVVGAPHPDPKQAGQGLARLRAGGLEVEAGVAAQACGRLVEPYAYAARAGAPFVLLKVATSLDGRIATRTGHSQWITSEAARAEARRLRSTVPAILAGVGTVLADDPLLTARVPGRPEPLRVILDSRLRTPTHSQIVRTARVHPTLILTTRAASARARVALERHGVEVQVVRATRRGQVDVRASLAALHTRRLAGVLVEGGAAVHGAFLDAGLVQRVCWFVAPLLLGGDRVALAGRGVARLDEALRLVEVEVQPFGPDLLITGRVPAPGGAAAAPRSRRSTR